MTEPDLKTRKYDRQLRLWQSHGQEALEKAKICLVNGSALGTEILKNLVLPGIGSYTVVDDKIVDGADVGHNFFLTQQHLGTHRAKAVAELLAELNDQVTGSHVDEEIGSLVNKRPEFFLDFTLVIASSHMSESVLLKLSDICWKANIPLVVVRVYGFIGYIRLVVPEHTIIETHPDQIIDLRLDCPFETLEAMNSATLSHTPYVVLLLKCLKEFTSKHGHPPHSSQEKADYKNLIRSKMTGLKDAENFEEALHAAYRASSSTKISSSLESIIQDPAAKTLTPESSSFWIMAHALSDFIQTQNNNRPPIAGTLPDMKADTESFVQLQNIYRNAAREDAKAVYDRVLKALTQLDKPADWISFEQVETFCKNSQHLKLIRYSSLRQEHEYRDVRKIARLLEDLDNGIVFYILLKTVDRFYETHRRYPGVHHHQVEGDISLLKKSVMALLHSLELSGSLVPDDHIHEMVRAGASEMHNMAALVGGMASQEIIKLITHQYSPLDNTLIFNGMKSTCTLLCM